MNAPILFPDFPQTVLLQLVSGPDMSAILVFFVLRILRTEPNLTQIHRKSHDAWQLHLRLHSSWLGDMKGCLWKEEDHVGYGI